MIIFKILRNSYFIIDIISTDTICVHQIRTSLTCTGTTFLLKKKKKKTKKKKQEIYYIGNTVK